MEADLHVEMVSRLLEDARAGLAHAVPRAVLPPPGSAPDRLRWLSSWPEVGPADDLTWLGLPDRADWRSIVIGASERFPEHWAAGSRIASEGLPCPSGVLRGRALKSV